jgi:hypothetical protein
MTRTRVGERVRINFYFDSQVFEAMKKLASLKNVTYSELIRTAAREYVLREGQKAINDAKTIKETSK